MNKATETAVRALAAEYIRDVLARRAVGDAHAEYHAQQPKTDAYKALLDAGCTPREAVAHFREVLVELNCEVTS